MPDHVEVARLHWAAIEVAKALIRGHGIHAEEEALRRAAAAETQDDREGASTWLKVADIIRKGLSGLSPSG
jgi:hypothetical protein